MIEVINRELLIPREEYNIGTCYDDNTETRHFHLKRVTSGGVDLAALTFNLDIQYADGNTDAASLVKEVTDKDINLVLTINNSMLQVPGTVLIQIRALDEDGVCKWTSYKSAFFVEDHINTPGHYEGDLTQLEQYEAEWGKVRDNVNQLNSRMDEVVKIHDDTPAAEVEEEVIDGRVGYNGTQYDSFGTAVRQQIIDVREDMEEDTTDWTEALAAEATARQTADNTLQGNINSEASTRASADSNLQSQINQIIAPSGEAPSAAEVQNARIGTDGTTYQTLGEAIRTQISDVNSKIYHVIDGTGLFEQGFFNINTGLPSDTQTSIRSVNILNDFLRVYCDTGYKFGIAAYDKDTEVFIGYWNNSGSAFQKSSKTIIAGVKVDLINLKRTYPSYNFKFILRNNDASQNISVSEASHIHFETPNVVMLNDTRFLELNDIVKNVNLLNANGNKFVVKNMIYGKRTDGGATKILCADNTANPINITYHTRAGVGHMYYTNMKKNYVNAKGVASVEGNNNRWFADGKYSTNLDGRENLFISSGTLIYASLFIIPRKLSSRKCYLIVSDGTTESVVECDSNNVFATKMISVSANTPIYVAVGIRSLEIDDDIDVDIYSFVSESPNAIYDSDIHGYGKETLIIGDDISFEYQKSDIINNNKVRVLEYNVGNFDMGGSTPSGTNVMYNNIVKTVTDTNPDIIGFNEFAALWNAEEDISSKTKFSQLRQYETSFDGSSDIYKNHIYSSNKILYEYYEDISVNESLRSFIDHTIEIAGRNVHFIITHLSPTDVQNDRISEINMIINYIESNNIEYAVIIGDMNTGHSDNELSIEDKITRSYAEINVWVNNGFKSAQGSVFGDARYSQLVQTMGYDVNVRLAPYDNIIVTPNIFINGFFTIDNGVSDHKANCFDLSFIS